MTPAQVSVIFRDGRRLSREQDDFEGAPGGSSDWDRTFTKFDAVAAPYADEDLRAAIVSTVAQLDTAPVSALTELLIKVDPERLSRPRF